MTTIVSRVNTFYATGQGLSIDLVCGTDEGGNYELTFNVSLADVAARTPAQLNTSLKGLIETRLNTTYGVVRGTDGHLLLGGVV